MRACGLRRLVVTVEYVRVQIESVGPDDRHQLWVDTNEPEVRGIAKRLAHITPENIAQVNDPLAPVAEPQAKLVPIKRLNVGHGHHVDNATATGRSPAIDRALGLAQLSPSSSRCSPAHSTSSLSARGGNHPSITSSVSIAISAT